MIEIADGLNLDLRSWHCQLSFT